MGASNRRGLIRQLRWWLWVLVALVLLLGVGAFVDPRAYAPVARAIADAGYRVVLVPVPLNQFGRHGPQSGDREATISQEEQTAQIVAATVERPERIAARQEPHGEGKFAFPWRVYVPD